MSNLAQPLKSILFKQNLNLHMSIICLPPAPYSFRLVSDVVGASVQCDTIACDTSDLNLTSPVRITIEHSVYVKVSNAKVILKEMGKK